ncbi:CBS domain-containing protein [Thermopolyspora sp. NPDC052614]|uniref:CBS domain-containing protein n=1 Tax=Thermopolyspora sp. NPDC052614 TaxID=3155682 RepID=UPI00344425B3
MLVREVMTSPAITVSPDDAVRRAIRILHENDITAAPVVDAAGALVGVVSEMDLLRGEFEPDPRATALPPRPVVSSPPRLVADVMTRDVVTVTETTDAAVLVELMVDKRIKSVPVLRGDRVVGVVSRRDLLGMLARPDEELRADVLALLEEHFPGGTAWRVTVADGVVELAGHAGPDRDGIAELLARTVPGVVRVRHVDEPAG